MWRFKVRGPKCNRKKRGRGTKCKLISKFFNPEIAVAKTSRQIHRDKAEREQVKSKVSKTQTGQSQKEIRQRTWVSLYTRTTKTDWQRQRAGAEFKYTGWLGTGENHTNTEMGKNTKQNQHQMGQNTGFKMKQETQKNTDPESLCSFFYFNAIFFYLFHPHLHGFFLSLCSLMFLISSV